MLYSGNEEGDLKHAGVALLHSKWARGYIIEGGTLGKGNF